MVVADESARVFSERLTPSFLSWLIAPGTGLVFFIMFFPMGTMLALLVGLGATVLAALAIASLATEVSLSTTHLMVGKARIEITSLGESKACSKAEFSHHMGPGSDARSFVLTRPWVPTGVYVEQTDPRDPTPYWLFSLRNPEQFVELLHRLQQEAV